MLCPQCGEGLLKRSGTGVPPPPPGLKMPRWSFISAPAGSGWITLLGLYHGLKHLAMAALLSYSTTSILRPVHSCVCSCGNAGGAVVAGTVNRGPR